jgi:hypothetical protein
MIGRRVGEIIECFARDRDYMLLANFESVRGFETERETLHKRRNVYRAAVAYGVVAWFLTTLQNP